MSLKTSRVKKYFFNILASALVSQNPVTKPYFSLPKLPF